jgi:hypothetical protein
MGAKDKLRRLEDAARGQLERFELTDGSRFWFDREQAGITRFLWSLKCAEANCVAERPDPPPIITALLEAKDRRTAFSKVYPESSSGQGFDIMPFDPDALIERGELVHVSMLAGRDDPNDAYVPDLSES